MGVINHTTIDQSVAIHSNETNASLTFCMCAGLLPMLENSLAKGKTCASRYSEQDISNSQIFTSERGEGNGDLQREPPLNWAQLITTDGF